MAEADPEIVAGESASEPLGSEAAAILLMLLGEDEAAQLLGRLDPQEVQHLGGAMFNVADVSEVQVNKVLDQFVDRAKKRTTLGFSSDRQIRGMMEKALGSERAENMLQRITPPARAANLDALKWMDTRTIAALVEHEHPQIIALVLAHLDPAVAADVLQLLPEEIQADLIQRVATMGPVTAEALEDLEALLMRPIAPAKSGGATRRGGTGEAAQIVNNTRKTAEQRIIKALQKLDKNLARSIEDEMFVFDNLMALDDKSMGTLMRSVDSEILVVALKGVDERMTTKIYGCMSSRAAQSIQDAIIEKGPMRLAEVQEAQKEVLSIARRLAAEGTINLGGKGDDYV
ncbi:flagellar motor switch protein FliG [Sphingomonas nostoxanthinifaciens]|uniref:flagellar motor switch protein FliG n=1 Tax=Sphingomonas nostoxanthinifaciens TaxID=2872652 RepID=UPI001CC1F930|nr:flagellar motor switch protein FliG [Sphingomonas nostoxanthinifaciens]UAK26033.1 flagellar motor switch protein FliG [Sphingomonas nostoxanthinifaciens]